MDDRLQVMEPSFVADWEDCERCPLAKTRRRVVFGAGNPHADILLIGEAPGDEEDRLGVPFVGQSGQTLNSFLSVFKLDRERDLFITNVCACRPFTATKTGAATKIENRAPTTQERTACWPRLEEIIYRVDPLIIVTMGKTPTAQVLGRKGIVMENAHGRVHSAIIPGNEVLLRYPVLPMYHPSFLLRNHNQEEGGPWQKTSLDFALLVNIVDRLRERYFDVEPPIRFGEEFYATQN